MFLLTFGNKSLKIDLFLFSHLMILINYEKKFFKKFNVVLHLKSHYLIIISLILRQILKSMIKSVKFIKNAMITLFNQILLFNLKELKKKLKKVMILKILLSKFIKIHFINKMLNLLQFNNFMNDCFTN
jgi:hypothetical protein